MASTMIAECGCGLQGWMSQHRRILAREQLSYVPVPRSSITCGFDEALSMIEIVPCTAPFFAGENVALMVHCAPGATREPQLEVTANPALAFID